MHAVVLMGGWFMWLAAGMCVGGSPLPARASFASAFLGCDSPDHLQGPKPRFPKIVAEIAAETAGETRGAGGSAGRTAARTAGGAAVSLLLRARAVPLAVSAAVSPSTPPSTPSFPGSFRSSLRNDFGEPGLGGPEDGRGESQFLALGGG